MNKIVNLIAIMAICAVVPIIGKPFRFINGDNGPLFVTINDPSTNRVIQSFYLSKSPHVALGTIRGIPSKGPNQKTIDIPSAPVKIMLREINQHPYRAAAGIFVNKRNIILSPKEFDANNGILLEPHFVHFIRPTGDLEYGVYKQFGGYGY